ncbi:hypothetical protein EW146_g9222 [Bondarzewia mesenterica]|uniref:PITH domain-containing protein n=1 Tax=Bondarzewia mesenterica TaxID=1095465 RepID=A0A4S4L8C3_9AGAM|nr:hypothetical protein EW146_g9222 [Bondarzewia mesenterica]
MPHDHNHSHDHGQCSDASHDHEHSDLDSGPKDNLYPLIDRANVTVLNGLGLGLEVIKPWHERYDEQVYLESLSDDQMILRIPFTNSVKLRSILLKTGPTDQTPAAVHLFANEDIEDFSDATERQPAQTFMVPQGRAVGEYTIKSDFSYLNSRTGRPSKFPASISSVTLFIPAAQGARTTRIYFVGFIGQFATVCSIPSTHHMQGADELTHCALHTYPSPLKSKKHPVVAVYESRANPVEHGKVNVECNVPAAF